ncbi:hypothetical protein BGW38_002631 [Lunasporangiospora selenospora]|uniref:Pro-apoptotic serine protease NMA111 n=1 Tax=Lunasporangiospora selenospora TaxID=979761 RepID=A0A9P6FRS9_9FUNG|nr:hypothetical protein BGW38_002631 [Lunasporangiospora selenospora]
MNRARRESLNCLNADKETLEYFACQEQMKPNPEPQPHQSRPGISGHDNRNRSKSFVYGLTWAQAMNGRSVKPSEMFGILNSDEATNWQGPWTTGPSSSTGENTDTNNTENQNQNQHQTHHHSQHHLPRHYQGTSGSSTALENNEYDDIGLLEEEEKLRLHNRGPQGGAAGLGGGGSMGGPKLVIGPGLPQALGVVPDTPKLTAQTWQSTLEKSIQSIVSITANHVRSFDTETSGAYSATGFVVDAKRGIVLSNRHVVSPAPILALAILSNYEEVELKPIYRDPIHDFGFMQFDTSKVKFMQLEEITLSPERARVGLDIRVVGNDAGEKLSILAGTLARLDRPAPDYGQGEYNDFNTFYLQAASSTSGGSSGSPVLDIDGHAVALNAGGASKASASYYLPLDRVKRALRYIQAGQKVPRGTLQTEFEYFPYDELRRLGLKISMEEQSRQRFPNETGMLVVKMVLPKGPAADKLIPGDILIQVNGEPVANFIHVFSILDDSVDQSVNMTVVRGSNSQMLTFTLPVQDLHSITPDRFVEVGGGVVNELSYQLAHSYGQPCGGVYVATPYTPATAIYPKINPALHPAPVIMPSFVAIDFHLPFLVDGMKATQFYGTGLVVSTNPPLVVCDRDTIPISIGDIFITFANSVIIPGRLVYLHPYYNFAVLTYDETLLADTPVKPATFSDKPLMQGDECYLVGVGTDQSPVIKKTTVSNVGNIGTRECSPPRWRAMNVEGIKIDDPVGTQGGVLCDQDGKVQALWVNYSSQDEKGNDITFMSGLDISCVRPVIGPFMNEEYPRLRSLDVEFWTMRIAAARSLGLTDDWVQRIESDPNSKHSLLYVLSLLDTSTPCSQMLKVGDIVLELEGKVATGMKDLERARSVESVQMTVLREGRVLNLTVPTVAMLGTDTNRIIAWAGALIQMPYKAVLEQVSNVPAGVYVSCTLYGSPASTALRPGVWITEVDGIPVADLDEFLDAVHHHEKKVVRSRQGSVCEVALKRLSQNSKKMSATVAQQQHLLAHPTGLPPLPSSSSIPSHLPSRFASAVGFDDGDGVHPHDNIPAPAPMAPSSLATERCLSPPFEEIGSPPSSPSTQEDLAQGAGYVRIKTQARNGTVQVIAMKLDPIYWQTTQLLPDPESVSGWKLVDVL